MSTAYFTSNQLSINAPVNILGSVGIGTTIPQYPLHVVGPDRRAEISSISSITYEDYTQWDAYNNRIGQSLSIFNGNGYASIPNMDLGFDLWINGQNYRNAPIYLNIHGCINFGSPTDSPNIPLINFTMPTLFIGYAGAHTVLDATYYNGNYDNIPSLFIFYEARGTFYFSDPSKYIHKWCVVIMSNGKIRIFINNVGDFVPHLFGFADGNGTWLVELPENNTNANPPYVNIAYELNITHIPIGTGINLIGNIVTLGNIVTHGNIGINTSSPTSALDVKGTIVTSNLNISDNINDAIYISLSGNIGIRTPKPTYPLHISGDTINLSGTYSSINYTNYMLWDEWANRTTLSLPQDTDDGNVLLPDVGFNLTICDINYRTTVYVSANGYITFGQSYTYYNNPVTNFIAPTLFVGYSDLIIDDLSYYIGNYNGESAIYLFFEGHDRSNSGFLYKWCAILQSECVHIFIQNVQNNSSCLFGFARNGAFLVQLPYNNTTPDPAITNTAYRINIIAIKGNALLVQGTSVVSGNIGIGSYAPVAALDVIGNVKATQFIGDGSLLTGGAWTSNTNGLYNTTQNIGIGTSIPSVELDVAGTIKATNLGIGTNSPSYPIDVVAPFITPSVVKIANAPVRSISVSADGTTLATGQHGYEGEQFVVSIYTYNGDGWTSSNLSIQPLPSGVYSGYPVPNYVSQASMSSDGLRIVAARGYDPYTSHFGDGNVVEIFHKIQGVWTSKAFIHKAGRLGWGCAMSGDGNTVALTSPRNNANLNYPGTIYVYKYNTNTDTWDETFSREYDNFVNDISLNVDGSVMAFSRTNNPRQPLSNPSSPSSSVVHILKYTNGMWNDVNDDILIAAPTGLLRWHYFGKQVCLSSDGHTLVVSAPGYNYPNNTNALNGVYVFTTSNSWTTYTSNILQPASYSNPSLDDYKNMFGNSIAVNDNGTRVVVGGNLVDVNDQYDSGKVWIFEYTNATWSILKTIDGTYNGEGIGFAVAIANDNKYIYVAARDSISQGMLYQYDYSPRRGRALQSTGDIGISENLIVDGNIGIGTVVPVRRLHIKNRLYSSITYDDFTLWTAYTNRTSSFTTNLYSSVLLPDFGFDFFVNNINIRNISYVNTNSCVSFGQQLATGFNQNNFGVVALHLGSGYTYAYDISYFIGFYNNDPAMYVFYDGYKDGDSDYVYKWCVVFQSNNNVYIFIKKLHNSIQTLSGIGLGDKTFLLELPENNKIVNPAIVDTAYELKLGLGPVMLVQGSATFDGKVGVGSYAPVAALDVIGNVKATQFIGDGSLLTGGAWTSNTNGVYNTTQNIGIGTSIPSVELDVAGTIKASQFIGDGSLLTGGAWSSNASSVYNTTQNIGIGTSNPLAKTHIYYTGAGDILRVDDSTAPDTSPFIINEDGNVGIGTSQPVQKLDVQGTIKATSFVGDGALLTSLNVGNVSSGTLTIERGGIGTSALTMNKVLVGNGTSAIISTSDLHWESGNLGIRTSSPSADLHIMGRIETGLGVFRVFPPQPMTSNTMNIINTPYGSGTYIASASSSNFGSEPYYLFDSSLIFPRFYQGDGNYDISSGNYTGTVSTTFTDFSNNVQTITGEWIQLKTPIPIAIHSYRVKPSGTTTNSPDAFVLLGSLDEITWKLVDDHRTDYVDWHNLNVYDESIITVAPALTTEYSYYRLVTNKIYLGIEKYLALSEITLFVRNKPQLTVIGEAYVSANTGIGTSTPLAKMHIYNTQNTDIFRVDDDASDTSPFIIKSDGNVGIGTIHPLSKFDVIGPINATSFSGNGALLTSLNVGNVSSGILSVEYGGIGTASLTANKLLVGNGTSAITQPTELHWNGANLGIGTAAPLAKTHIFSSGTLGGHILRVDDSAAPDTTPFVINNLGYVGIGKTQPLERLDVNGTVIATSFSGNGALLTSLNVGNVSAGTLSVGYGGIGTASLAANKLLVGNGTSAITQPTELHWDGANLGIGTSQPLHKLDVNGTINATSFVGSGALLTSLDAGNISAGTLNVTRGGIGTASLAANKLLVGNGTSAIIQPLLLHWDGGNLGIGTTNPNVELHLMGAIKAGLGSSNSYPPMSMTANTMNVIETPYGRGTYIVSASSSNGYSGLREPYYAFSDTTIHFEQGLGLYNNAGTYSGTVSTSFIDFSNNIVSYDGEWIQIQLPSPILLSKYGIKVADVYASPGNFVFLGSLDGLTWTLIDDKRSINVTTYSNSSEKQFVISPEITQTYSYFRLVTYKLNASGAVSIDKLQLYVKNQYQLSINGDAYFSQNVGIGSTQPTQALDVNGTIKATQFIGDGSLLIGISSGPWSSNASSVYNTTQNVGIGTTNPATALVVNGTIRNLNGPAPTSGTSLVITGDGDIAPQSSDARYKNDIEDIPPVLDAVMNMRAVSYRWKDEPHKWYGLLAQQIAEVFPDAAWHDAEKDTFGVHYTPSIVTLLLKAIQEMKQSHDTRITTLEQEIERLKSL